MLATTSLDATIFLATGGEVKVLPAHGSDWRTLRFGDYPTMVQIFFEGSDAPLAEKIATLVAQHRAEVARAAETPTFEEEGA